MFQMTRIPILGLVLLFLKMSNEANGYQISPLENYNIGKQGIRLGIGAEPPLQQRSVFSDYRVRPKLKAKQNRQHIILILFISYSYK